MKSRKPWLTWISTWRGRTPSWWPIRGCARRFFSLVTDEYHRTVAVVRRLTGCSELAERFPQFRQRLASRLPTLNQVNRQQIDLLRRYRATRTGKPPEDQLAALLLSINCIAAGVGTTG